MNRTEKIKTKQGRGKSKPQEYCNNCKCKRFKPCGCQKKIK